MKPRCTRTVLRLSRLACWVSRELTYNLYKLRIQRKLHRFSVSNTATDAVKFILDRRVCAVSVRMNCNVVYALAMLISLLGSDVGTSFQFFTGGHNFDPLPRGRGQNMKNTKFCRRNHQKVTIFQNQGGQMPRCPPPQMTSLVRRFCSPCI